MEDAERYGKYLGFLRCQIKGRDIAKTFRIEHKGKRYFCPSCQPGGRRNHKTPDMIISDFGFKCHKCGIKGDNLALATIAGRMSEDAAIKFLEDYSGTTYQGDEYQHTSQIKKSKQGQSDAIRDDLQKMINVIQNKEKHSDLYETFLRDVCQPIGGTPGEKYLMDRGINSDLADQYGIRYCSDLSGLWKLAEKKVIKSSGLSSFYVFQKNDLPFLVFPYHRSEKVVYIKARNLLSKADADHRSLPRFLNTGGQVPCLWNHDAIQTADQVLICEGEIDALTAIQVGYVGTGLPGWSHWKNIWTADFKGKDVILVMDADESGQKGATDIAVRFIEAGLPGPRQMILQDGKDLNDVFQESMKDGKVEL